MRQTSGAADPASVRENLHGQYAHAAVLFSGNLPGDLLSFA
jgi:hypothetical protein